MTTFIVFITIVYLYNKKYQTYKHFVDFFIELIQIMCGLDVYGYIQNIKFY